MFKWLAAPGPKPRLSAEQIARKFPRLRFQVFMGIFLGYAGFYLIRNNIPRLLLSSWKRTAPSISPRLALSVTPESCNFSDPDCLGFLGLGAGWDHWNGFHGPDKGWFVPGSGVASVRAF